MATLSTPVGARASATTSSPACRRATPPRCSSAASAAAGAGARCSTALLRGWSSGPRGAGAGASRPRGAASRLLVRWRVVGGSRRPTGERRAAGARRRQDVHRAVRPGRGPGPAGPRADRRAGRRCSPRSARRSPSTRCARGEIDAYVDYTGTLWATLMQPDRRRRRREAVLAEVERLAPRAHGVAWPARSGFENTYALRAARGATPTRSACAASATSRRQAPRLAAGGDYEFFAARRSGARCSAAYGLRFREQRSMDPSLLYAGGRRRSRWT